MAARIRDGWLQARSCDQALHGARNQHLASCCERGDAGANVHGNTANLVPDSFAFTSMESCAHLDSKWTEIFDDRARTSDRSGGAVKCDEEAVGGGLVAQDAISDAACVPAQVGLAAGIRDGWFN
ncbi:hypothetical protein WKW80_28470 [Variovorax humicola]|uniref:Uncharacterized protein n=1 Tax=Variovorax humicola TaxID=1769758 RepID=A0ABU8W9F0_9BURK